MDSFEPQIRIVVDCGSNESICGASFSHVTFATLRRAGNSVFHSSN